MFHLFERLRRITTTMRFDSYMAVVAIAVSTCVQASPATSRLFARASTPNTNGVHDGWYYTWWTDGASSDATYTNGPGGSYSVNWVKGKGDLYGGKGWQTGSAKRYASVFIRPHNG